MNKKCLKNNIKKEGDQLVPTVLDRVYSNLGITFNSAEQAQEQLIESKIKDEGKKFVPNNIDQIYAACKIAPLSGSKETAIEDHLKDESADFIPDVKGQVYNGINHAKPRLSFAQFFKKPTTIAFTSAILVGAIATVVIIPNVLNKGTDDSSSSTEVISGAPTVESTVNMKLTSASQSYAPETLYCISTTGKINNEKIVSLNDYSTNILNNFETGSNKAILSKEYDASSFTSAYLTTALNLGYLERQDISKTNIISVNIIYDQNDAEYYNSVVNVLQKEIDSFIYNNKVVASISIKLSSEEENASVDSNLIALIRQAYELATKLFVDADGNVITILCFSTNYDDWLNKYKDSSVDEMQKYVDYLLSIQDKISTDANKAAFLAELAKCEEYQKAVDNLVIKYNELDAAQKVIINLYNQMTGENMPPYPNSLNGDGWDWWDDYGHDHYHDGEKDWPLKARMGEELTIDGYNKLISDIDTLKLNYDTSSNPQELLDAVDNIKFYLNEISRYYKEFSNRINQSFGDTIGKVDNGDYYDDNPHFDNHYEDTPKDWDQSYDNWWNNHHH